LIAETRGTDLHDVLRERLVFMRTDLIERLAKGGIDGGMLALLGSVGAAIAAIDAIPAKEEGKRAGNSAALHVQTAQESTPR